MEITYQDDVGDVVYVSDDEDLLAAYDVAESSMKGQIKFFIKPRKTDKMTKPEMSISEKVQGQLETNDPELTTIATNTELNDLMSENDSSESDFGIMPEEQKTKDEKKRTKGKKFREADDLGPQKKALKRFIRK